MAVYTEVSAEELTDFLKDYDLGSLLSFKGIAEGVENSNYILETEQGRYILTLYEKRVAEKDIPFFLNLMGYFADHSLPCPLPVKAKDGAALRKIAGKNAVIVTFLEGISYKKPLPIHCSNLGLSLAKLHIAGEKFSQTRENTLSIDGWKDLAKSIGEKAEKIAPGLKIAIKNEIDFLQLHWPRTLPSGIIHGDLFPNNALFIGEKLSGIIDFYFAAYDAFAYDLAICLNAWCFEADLSFNITKGKALLAAYKSKRAMNHIEIKSLPILCRGAALRFLLTRLFDWFNTPKNGYVRPLDPMEYWKKLRFHQAIEEASNYGWGE